MATAFPSAAPELDMSDWPQCSKAEDGKHLAHVSDVFINKGKFFTLKEPAGAKLKIAELDDTIYRDEEEVVNGWGKFYLPDSDKQVYAYDGEDLHLVASNLVQVFEEGIEYPASKSYYRGEAFKDMTEGDWAEVNNGPEGRRLEKDHQELIKSTFMEYLKPAGHT